MHVHWGCLEIEKKKKNDTETRKRETQKTDRERLQRMVKTAQKISRAEAITRDDTHPVTSPVRAATICRRYRSIRTRTNSFFPQAITALNTNGHWHTHTHTHTTQGQCAIIVKHCTFLSIYSLYLHCTAALDFLLYFYVVWTLGCC